MLFNSKGQAWIELLSASAVLRPAFGGSRGEVDPLADGGAAGAANRDDADHRRSAVRHDLHAVVVAAHAAARIAPHWGGCVASMVLPVKFCLVPRICFAFTTPQRRVPPMRSTTLCFRRVISILSPGTGRVTNSNSRRPSSTPNP